MEDQKPQDAAARKPAQPAGKKAGPTKLPSKPISFSGQSVAKSTKGGKVNINSQKKGGVNLMRKLSGM